MHSWNGGETILGVLPFACDENIGRPLFAGCKGEVFEFTLSLFGFGFLRLVKAVSGEF